MEVVPTKTADLKCGVCGANTFQDTGSSRLEACSPQPVCGAREKISPDSQVAERACSQCPNGECQSEESHRNLFCVPEGASCPEGTRSVAGIDEVKSRDDFQCIPCGEDEHKVGTSSATECETQPMCAAGQFMGPRSAVARRVCEPCTAGTFRTDVSHRRVACDPWTECTRKGQFQAEAPTAKSDRVCGSTLECLDDEWESRAMTLDSARQCTRLTLCGQGQMAVLPEDKSADLSCVACKIGMFQTSGSHRTPACPPLPPLQCPAGERPSDPSLDAAQACQQCGSGDLCMQPTTAQAVTLPAAQAATPITPASPATLPPDPTAAAQETSNNAAARDDGEHEGSDSDDDSSPVTIVVVVLLLGACVVVGAILLKHDSDGKAGATHIRTSCGNLACVSLSKMAASAFFFHTRGNSRFCLHAGTLGTFAVAQVSVGHVGLSSLTLPLERAPV